MTALVNSLALKTGLRQGDVRRIMASAPVRYKVYSIPNRNGGHRVIAQPAREVKLLQRALVLILLKDLPVHPCAKGYREHLSILDNALPHAGHRPILKMDLKDFFPSIR